MLHNVSVALDHILSSRKSYRFGLNKQCRDRFKNNRERANEGVKSQLKAR